MEHQIYITLSTEDIEYLKTLPDKNGLLAHIINEWELKNKKAE